MITSFSNPLVKRVKRLKQKKYRIREEVFFVEGLRNVLSAVDADAPIETIIYCGELLRSEPARRMLAEEQNAGINCVELAEPVFRSISDRENPVGLGAIVKTNRIPIENFEMRPDDIFIALVEVSEPGNLGTVLRTIDAVGGSGLILVGNTVDPYHPRSVKASMGTLFSVPFSHIADMEVLIHWAKMNALQMVATSARAGTIYEEAVYRTPTLLILGSEGEGLPANVLERSDYAVSIPMSGMASSLNLAVAAGLLLYEVRRKVNQD